MRAGILTLCACPFTHLELAAWFGQVAIKLEFVYSCDVPASDLLLVCGVAQNSLSHNRPAYSLHCIDTAI